MGRGGTHQQQQHQLRQEQQRLLTLGPAPHARAWAWARARSRLLLRFAAQAQQHKLACVELDRTAAPLWRERPLGGAERCLDGVVEWREEGDGALIAALFANELAAPAAGAEVGALKAPKEGRQEESVNISIYFFLLNLRVLPSSRRRRRARCQRQSK